MASITGYRTRTPAGSISGVAIITTAVVIFVGMFRARGIAPTPLAVNIAWTAIPASVQLRIRPRTGTRFLTRRERGEVEQADAHHKGQDDRQNAIQYFLHFFEFLSLHFSDAKGPAVGLP